MDTTDTSKPKGVSSVSLRDISKADRYVYSTRRGGKGLLFNHEVFDDEMKKKKRSGTHEDGKKLVKLFQDRNIQLEHCIDLTFKQIVDKIKNVSAKSHDQMDLLLVIVLTHGSLSSTGEEIICASDQTYSPSELWLPFSPERCPSLAGKPKIFIFQCCRGSEGNTGIGSGSNKTMPRSVSATSQDDSQEVGSSAVDPQEVATSADDTKELGTSANDIAVKRKSTRQPRIHNMPDLLLARCTVIGYMSFRIPERGSIYINTLVKLMEEFKKKVDIISLLTMAHDKVAKLTVSLGSENYLQMPCYTSTLTRQLYL